jgi:hypothetical protein
MATDPDLSRSEYVVLALIARYGPMTPYELKDRVTQSVGVFWPIRRRNALGAWLADHHASRTQIRDPALLKLAFAGLGSRENLSALAAAQAAGHHSITSA